MAISSQLKLRLIRLWRAAVLLFLFSILVAAGCWIWKVNNAHQHCIQAAYLQFELYAEDHFGVYPSHTNGFGDALVLLEKTEPGAARSLVGVGDNENWILSAASNQLHVPVERCSRIYVQGLNRKSDPELALFFDRYAVRGGDHSRSPSEPHLREVVFIGHGMSRVTVKDRSAFASHQVDLLVKEGIERPVAESYYAPTLRPDAIR